MSFRGWIWACMLSLTVAAPARAQHALPPQVEAPILLRVLAYDRALERRRSDELVVAILYDVASNSSNHDRVAMGRAFRSAPVQSIGRKTLRYVELNVANGENLANALRRDSVAAAYVTDGLKRRLNFVLDAASASHVTTLSGNSWYARQGVAVAVDTLAGRPQIYVNLSSARAAGADFTAALLKLATVLQ